MDLIAMRFEARHLEVEGKLQEALEVCRDILRHHASEPPTDELLPVIVQASELSTKLGDREGAATLLLLAAERYAEAGLARPVIDLYQRLRRLGPGHGGLDLHFARRMLEHRHPTAAREFLTDLARRQKKEKLLATLQRMASWHDDKVQYTLLDFLDKAQGIRGSAAQAPPTPSTAHPTTQRSQPVTAAPPRSQETTEVRPAAQASTPPAAPAAPSGAATEVRPAARAPEPPPTTRPTVETGPRQQAPSPAQPSEPVTAPRRGVRPATESPAAQTPPPSHAADRAPPAAASSPEPRPSTPRKGGVMPSDAVVFVQPELDPTPGPPRTARRPIIPPRQRRRRAPLGRIGMVVALLVVAAGAVSIVLRLRGAPPTPVVVAAEPNAAGAAVEQPPVAAPARGVAVPDSMVVSVPGAAESIPVAASTPAAIAAAPPVVRRESVAAAPPAVAQPVPVSPPVTPPSRPAVDTVRPAASPTPPPVSTVSAAPPAPAGPRVEYPVVVVEGLEIAEISREGAPPAQRVVVKQLLPTGDTLDLRESDLGEQSVSVGAGRLLVRRHPSGGSLGTVRVGRFLVNARAPVEPEVLEPLLRRLVERN